jgi:hypothetical protein
LINSQALASCSFIIPTAFVIKVTLILALERGTERNAFENMPVTLQCDDVGVELVDRRLVDIAPLDQD